MHRLQLILRHFKQTNSFDDTIVKASVTTAAEGASSATSDTPVRTRSATVVVQPLSVNRVCSTSTNHCVTPLLCRDDTFGHDRKGKQRKARSVRRLVAGLCACGRRFVYVGRFRLFSGPEVARRRGNIRPNVLPCLHRRPYHRRSSRRRRRLRASPTFTNASAVWTSRRRCARCQSCHCLRRRVLHRDHRRRAAHRRFRRRSKRRMSWRSRCRHVELWPRWPIVRRRRNRRCCH